MLFILNEIFHRVESVEHVTQCHCEYDRVVIHHGEHLQESRLHVDCWPVKQSSEHDLVDVLVLAFVQECGKLGGILDDIRVEFNELLEEQDCLAWLERGQCAFVLCLLCRAGLLGVLKYFQHALVIVNQSEHLRQSNRARPDLRIWVGEKHEDDGKQESWIDDILFLQQVDQVKNGEDSFQGGLRRVLFESDLNLKLAVQAIGGAELELVDLLLHLCQVELRVQLFLDQSD